jgi:ATP-dependent exoDNAse (exonuclease V) beta subunit
MISMPAVFNSWPLNPQDGVEDAPVNERGRLKFNADASDFFNEEGSAGVDASQRIKGIVLHDILANVSVPDDLDAAVEAAVVAGTLPAEDAQQVKEMLNGCICSVEAEGWFPEDRSCVLNEMELIDTDGKIYRPDRVVRYGDKILIVDYKFGEHHRKYERQLKRYADLWTRMGYNVESAKLWYVFTGEIVAVV